MDQTDNMEHTRTTLGRQENWKLTDEKKKEYVSYKDQSVIILPTLYEHNNKIIKLNGHQLAMAYRLNRRGP